jgi:hypothetical protein
MSGIGAAVNRPSHPFQTADLTQALHNAESFEILIEATPWIDVHRAWTLVSGSLRYADAIYVAAAERHKTALLTADARTLRRADYMRDHHGRRVGEGNPIHRVRSKQLEAQAGELTGRWRRRPRP